MARYKIIDRNPRFLPVVLDAQLMSGSFEYALDYLSAEVESLRRKKSTQKSLKKGVFIQLERSS